MCFHVQLAARFEGYQRKHQAGDQVRVNILKFDDKDRLKWFKLIDNYFRCALAMWGVMLDCVYREQAEPKPRVKYPLIAEEIKVMLLLKGPHFEEEAGTIYIVVTNLTLGTSAYAYVKKFEKSRDDNKAMLALKLQFGGKAYIVLQCKGRK
jgi:hypothetical protein